MRDAEIEELEKRNEQLLEALNAVMEVTRSEVSILKPNSPAKRAFRIASSAVQN